MPSTMFSTTQLLLFRDFFSGYPSEVVIPHCFTDGRETDRRQTEEGFLNDFPGDNCRGVGDWGFQTLIKTLGFQVSSSRRSTLKNFPQEIPCWLVLKDRRIECVYSSLEYSASCCCPRLCVCVCSSIIPVICS